MSNKRITLQDTPIEILTKLSEGNPGALTVMLKILQEGEAIDPQSADPLFTILGLDTMEIYGPRIWMLFKDVCGESIVDTLAALRAVQLGIISEATLNKAIDNYGEGMPEGILDLVKLELIQFAK